MKHSFVFSDHKWLSLDDETASIYNDWDVYGTAIAYKGIRQELKDNRQDVYFQNHVWPLIAPIRRLQKHGLYLDVGALSDHRRKIAQEINELNQAILFYSDRPDLNIDSNEQIAELLYVKRGLRCHKYTDSGMPSVDQEALFLCHAGLRKKDEPVRPLLEHLFHRSKLKTIQERYLGVEADRDGRVRPRIKFPGTETFRLAYSDPPEQQRPEMVRNIYCAPPGSVLIGADYSQLEARIMAYLANDQQSIAVFESGEDIHTANVLDLFELKLEEWNALDNRQQKELRDFAKSFLYRLMYGGSAKTAKQKFFCPCPKCVSRASRGMKRDDIKQADVRWLMKHPSVPAWRKRLVWQVRNNGWYTDPFGGRRCFMAPMSEIERELYNYPMQKTAADIVNESMIIGEQEYEMPFFMQMHDFLGIEVPIEDAKLWTDRLVDIMTRPIPQLGGVRFPVEVKMGRNWRDMHKIKHNNG